MEFALLKYNINNKAGPVFIHDVYLYYSNLCCGLHGTFFYIKLFLINLTNVEESCSQ